MIDMTENFEREIVDTLRRMLTGQTIHAGCGAHRMALHNDGGIYLSRKSAMVLLARLDPGVGEAAAVTERQRT